MINKESDVAGQPNTYGDLDFLEAPDLSKQNSPFDFSGLVEAINLNTRELRKIHGQQRCTFLFEWINCSQPGRLTSTVESCRIYFQVENKNVKAQKLLVSNQANGIDIIFSINEPLLNRGVASGLRNGISLGSTGSARRSAIELDMEIEWIEVGILGQGGGFNVEVNNSLGGIPADGLIQIYAWSIPDAAFQEISDNTYQFRGY